MPSLETLRTGDTITVSRFDDPLTVTEVNARRGSTTDEIVARNDVTGDEVAFAKTNLGDWVWKDSPARPVVTMSTPVTDRGEPTNPEGACP